MRVSDPPNPARCPPVAVVIPAREEGAGIGRSLAALSAQRGAPPFTVLVLVNNSRDDTADQARRWQGRLPLEVRDVTLPPGEAHVGGARRRALDWGAEHAGPGGLLVSTDADTQAHPDWLAALLRPLYSEGLYGEGRSGEPRAAASAGRILLRAEERAALPPAVRATHLFDTGYRQAAAQLRAHLVPSAGEPRPTHWQHFGASLALTVQAYRAVGGLPPVTCLEDMALVAALRRAGLTVQPTHAARVYTSARLSGRVAVGLSTQLGEWARGPQAWRVPGGAELVAQGRAEEALYRFWAAHSGPSEEAPSLSALARAWRLDPGVADLAVEAPTRGAALEALRAARDRAGVWAAEFPPVPVRQALWEVRAALEPFGGEGLRTRPRVGLTGGEPQTSAPDPSPAPASSPTLDPR